MQDLSHLLPGDPVSCLVPTSQSGGNQVVSNANARTAPGSEPSTPYTSLAGEVIGHPAPDVQAIDHSQRVAVERGHSRPARIALGQWNDMGGGPGPS